MHENIGRCHTLFFEGEATNRGAYGEHEFKIIFSASISMSFKSMKQSKHIPPLLLRHSLYYHYHFFVRVREQIEVLVGSMIFNRFLANINV